jgi:hypothetical protein
MKRITNKKTFVFATTQKIFSFLLLLHTSSYLSAEVIDLPDSPGKWRIRSIEFFEGDRLADYGWSKKEVDTLSIQMAKMADTIRRAEANPMGADRSLAGRIEYSYEPEFARLKDKLYLPVSGYFILNAFTHYSHQGKTKVSSEGPGVMIYINGPFMLGDLRMGAGKSDSKNGKEEGVYLEAKKTGEVRGFPVYNNMLVITRNRNPMWIPVNRERVLRVLIRDAERMDAESKKAREGLPVSRIEAMNSEIRERAAKRNNPRILEAIPGERARMLKEELESLSASDRESIAYYSDRLNCYDYDRVTTSSCLVSADTLGARRLVIPNPDFYDTSLPKSSIQLIKIRDFADFEQEIEEARSRKRPVHWGRQKQVEFVHKVEWRKIADMFLDAQ